MNNKWAKYLFKYRGLIPVPFFFIIYFFSKPTKYSIIIGTLVLFLGEIIRIWAGGYIKKYRTLDVDAPELITYGPYGYVRNPLYIGNFFIGLGISVMSNTLFSYIIFFSIYFFGYSIIIPLEEKFLKEKWKNEYLKYANNVHRVFPRIKPYKVKKSFDFYAALRSEKSTFLVELFVLFLFILRLKI